MNTHWKPGFILSVWLDWDILIGEAAMVDCRRESPKRMWERSETRAAWFYRRVGRTIHGSVGAYFV